MTNDTAYWLAALHLPPIAPRKFLRCVAAFPNIRALFTASTAEWTALGLSPKIIAALQTPDWKAVETELAWGEQPHHHLIPITHADYPALLKEIANPPLLLYVRGNKTALQQTQIALVGSRHATVYGCAQAKQFATDLARANIVVTSGLAAGIDTASHRGALAGNGLTVGVAGTGLNHIYPYSNRSLIEAILSASGAVVSEFVLDAKAHPYHFPQRNRIISGLSRGVVVVEAALKSGSLITARHALEQGREVFAMPGAVTNLLARGCHHLIRQGAKLVESTQDILEELSFLPLTQRVDSTLAAGEKGPDLSKDYATFLQHIAYEMTPMDVIVLRSGLTASEVSSMLLKLELAGYVRPVTGGYIKTMQSQPNL